MYCFASFIMMIIVVSQMFGGLNGKGPTRTLKRVGLIALFLSLACLIFCGCVVAGFSLFGEFSKAVSEFGSVMSMRGTVTRQKFPCDFNICFLLLVASRLFSVFICAISYRNIFLIDTHICGNEHHGFRLPSVCGYKKCRLAYSEQDCVYKPYFALYSSYSC